MSFRGGVYASQHITAHQTPQHHTIPHHPLTHSPTTQSPILCHVYFGTYTTKSLVLSPIQAGLVIGIHVVGKIHHKPHHDLRDFVDPENPFLPTLPYQIANATLTYSIHPRLRPVPFSQAEDGMGLSSRGKTTSTLWLCSLACSYSMPVLLLLRSGSGERKMALLGQRAWGPCS